MGTSQWKMNIDKKNKNGNICKNFKETIIKKRKEKMWN